VRDYGRVYTAFWSSHDIRTLSDDGRLLALYLLTSPHTTIIGVFRLPDGYACEDLQWTPERVRKGFVELFNKGFSNRCETTKWVWICKFLEWNAPENPNQWKAARKIAAQIPDVCSWKSEFSREFSLATDESKPSDIEPITNGSETLSKPGTGTGVGTGSETGDGDSAAAAASPPSKRVRAKTPKTTLPADLKLDDELQGYTESKLPEVDATAFFEGFCGKALSKGWTYSNWRQAYMEFCRNAAPDSGHWAAGQYPRKRPQGEPMFAGRPMEWQ